MERVVECYDAGDLSVIKDREHCVGAAEALHRVLGGVVDIDGGEDVIVGGGKIAGCGEGPFLAGEGLEIFHAQEASEVALLIGHGIGGVAA